MPLLDENVADEELDDINEGDDANGLLVIVDNVDAMNASLGELLYDFLPDKQMRIEKQIQYNK